MKRLCILTLFLIVAVAGCIQNPPIQEVNQTIQSVSISEIFSSPEKYLDKNISVSGLATSYNLRCTQEACMPENKCCNSCGGKFGLKEGENILEVRGIACRGDNCKQQCGSFETGKNYTITEVLKKEGEKLFIEYAN